MFKFCPYVVRFEAERIADRHKGEKTVKFIAKKPLLSFPRAPYKPRIRFKLFMKAEKRIFEHGVHQCRLGANGYELNPRVEKLFSKEAVVVGPLICGGSTGGYNWA
jgi:hypothetical protein